MGHAANAAAPDLIAVGAAGADLIAVRAAAADSVAMLLQTHQQLPKDRRLKPLVHSYSNQIPVIKIDSATPCKKKQCPVTHL